MTDKPVSVYFTAENRTFWLHGLFWGLVTLGLAFALRMLEWPCWQNPEYRLGSEWLLATHDAYHWVAGAEGFGHAVGHPMAVHAARHGRSAGDLSRGGGLLVPGAAFLLRGRHRLRLGLGPGQHGSRCGGGPADQPCAGFPGPHAAGLL